MSPLLVIALVVAALIVYLLAGETPFIAKASKIGGFAFVLYAIVLGIVYLIGLVGKG